jgi:muramoyltetrapeptide carboxypeptidase
MSRIYPPPLDVGDTVAIVSPASPPRRQPLERAIELLEEAGLKWKTYGDIYRSSGYLAGTDQRRAAELMAAFADPEVKAVLPTRGGNGMVRILDQLDYDVIAQNPKIVVGFSDITALHLAIHAKTQLITFHGPHLQDGLGTDDGLDPVSQATYEQALFANTDDTGELVSNELLAAAGALEISCNSPGMARGPLVGGNLALICALQGTEFEIQTNGCVLLLEEVNEQPYRVDRYLAQLRLAGKLSSLAGVLLGHFTDCRAAECKPSATTDNVLAEYFAPLNVPVVTSFPSGHDRPNVTLPIGGIVELDADRGSLHVVDAAGRM